MLSGGSLVGDGQGSCGGIFDGSLSPSLPIKQQQNSPNSPASSPTEHTTHHQAHRASTSATPTSFQFVQFLPLLNCQIAAKRAGLIRPMESIFMRNPRSTGTVFSPVILFRWLDFDLHDSSHCQTPKPALDSYTHEVKFSSQHLVQYSYQSFRFQFRHVQLPRRNSDAEDLFSKNHFGELSACERKFGTIPVFHIDQEHAKVHLHEKCRYLLYAMYRLMLFRMASCYLI